MMLGVSENGGLNPQDIAIFMGVATKFRGLGSAILRQPIFGNKYRKFRRIKPPGTYFGMAGLVGFPAPRS